MDSALLAAQILGVQNIVTRCGLMCLSLCPLVLARHRSTPFFLLVPLSVHGYDYNKILAFLLFEEIDFIDSPDSLLFSIKVWYPDYSTSVNHK